MEGEVLKLIQEDMPLVPRPFEEVGKRAGLKEGEVIEFLKRLKEEGILRQVSPIYDTKRAGYDSALVAFRVEPEHLESVAKEVSSHPGVSHSYERDHSFNLWFTLAVPPDSRLSLEETVEILSSQPGVREFKIMRAVRTFKIGVKLNFSSMFEKEEVINPREERPLPFSPLEKEVIKKTQEGLPLVPRPFEDVAKEMGINEKLLLELLKGLKNKGVMRRFSAILKHRKLGFEANGLVVWKVQKERVEEVGRYLSRFKCVSHCYERSGWEFNLFTMVHGRSKEEVEGFVKRVGEELGLFEREILFSKREFVKRRVKLFGEEFYEWEREKLGACAY